MTQVKIIENPPEKLLRMIELMKKKKDTDQKKLAENKECTFKITV